MEMTAAAKLAYETSKTLKELRKEFELDKYTRVISSTSSTSGFAHIIVTKNERFKHLNMFVVRTSDNYTVTVIMYSDSAYAFTPNLGDTYLSISPTELLRCIPNGPQDDAIAKQYLAANSEDLVSMLSAVLKSQSSLIEITRDENEKLSYEFKNILPHVKKAYQGMIPKRFR